MMPQSAPAPAADPHGRLPFGRTDDPGLAVGWTIAGSRVAFPQATATMERRVTAIREGSAAELVWLLEHPPLYTAGTSARDADLIEPGRFPVYRSGRGGQFTYHGPGQRVGYVMLDVGRRWGDVRAYVTALETLIIDALAALGVESNARSGLVGVWVRRQEEGTERHEKIAAIGVRLRRWVSSHGFSINVAPELAHFSGIVPCGIRDDGVTSLAQLGSGAGLEELDLALRSAFEHRIGPTCDAAAGT